MYTGKKGGQGGWGNTLLSECLEQAMFRQVNCHLQFEIIQSMSNCKGKKKKNYNNIIKERDNV